MKTAHVVFNPASGGYSQRQTERILLALRRGGIATQPLLPTSTDEATCAVRGLCQSEQQPLIVAVGGDGTINTVLNGMLAQRATLGVIPLGTANVVAWELGIRSIDDAVTRIVSGRQRSFSVGEATSNFGVRRFLLMAGVGLDATVVAGVRPAEKKLLGKLAYLLSCLRQLLNWDRTTLRILDGQHSLECQSVIISNARHYGGPYRLAPQADIFAPRLEVIPLNFPTRRSFFLAALALVMAGRAPESFAWQVPDGRFEINGTKAVQLDGDTFGTGPVSIRLIPDFNRLRC